MYTMFLYNMLFTYIYKYMYHISSSRIYIYYVCITFAKQMKFCARWSLLICVFSHWRGLKWFPQYEINIFRSLGWVTWSETLAGQTVNFDSGELENALTALFLSTRMSWMMMKWRTKRPTRQTKMKWSSLGEKHRKTAQKAWISQMSIYSCVFKDAGCVFHVSMFTLQARVHSKNQVDWRDVCRVRHHGAASHMVSPWFDVGMFTSQGGQLHVRPPGPCYHWARVSHVSVVLSC
jgi:hypothetical protein